ncbi:MAG: hypothetical protein KDH97_12715 [Calditrichaeota bacterium]|nr:hypothetical protein [Calditrichota bacterium]
MKPEKLADILRKTIPPQVHLPAARAALRRELLNSPYYRQREARRRVKRYLLSALATLAVLLAFLIPNLIPREMTAGEIIHNLETAYARAGDFPGIHYLKMRVEVVSTQLSAMIEEKWIHDNYREFRVLTRAADSGEILGHTIIRNDSTYRRPEDRLVYDIRLDIAETDSAVETTGDAAPEIETAESDFDVRMYPLAPRPGSAPEETELQILFTRYSFNFESLSRQTPWDVIARLKQHPAVHYAGTVRDSLSGEQREVLEIRRHAGGFMMRLRGNAVDHRAIRRITDRLNEIDDNSAEPLQIDSYRLYPLFLIERIEVDAAENRIHRVTRLLRRDDRVYERSAIIFIDDAFLPYDPAIFDPGRFGLEEE